MASKQIRPIRVEGNVAYVTLTKGYEAIIDAADVPLVQHWLWHAHVVKRRDGSIRGVYARRNEFIDGKKSPIYLHRSLMGRPSEVEVDHRDGDGLNNRRGNLREATHAENQCNGGLRDDNTSGFRGVYWNQTRGKWYASIGVDGKRLYLGAFEALPDAAAAYAEASARLHGEFGRVA